MRKSNKSVPSRQINKHIGLTVICAVCAFTAAARVRTEKLSDGWMFRLEGESEARPVTVPHDWGIEKGFLEKGACPGQGDLPYVGKGFYRRAFDGFTPPEGGRTYLTLDGVQCRSVVKLNGKVNELTERLKKSESKYETKYLMLNLSRVIEDEYFLKEYVSPSHRAYR